MGAHEDYRAGLLARFDGRDVLSKDELYDRFWASKGLDRAEVIALFDLVEEAYYISPGLLRPSDPIEMLTDRVPEQHWWRGPVHDVIAGDRQFWVQEELGHKLRQYVRLNTKNQYHRRTRFGMVRLVARNGRRITNRWTRAAIACFS
jgi:hypothetical protein